MNWKPCFVVKDGVGQKLAYVYFEQGLGRRSAAKLLTKDEARRIAVNIAKLPDSPAIDPCVVRFPIQERSTRESVLETSAGAGFII